MDENAATLAEISRRFAIETRNEWAQKFRAVEVDHSDPDLHHPASINRLVDGYLAELRTTIEKRTLLPATTPADTLLDPCYSFLQELLDAFRPFWGRSYTDDGLSIVVPPYWHALGRDDLLRKAQEGKAPPFSIQGVNSLTGAYLVAELRTEMLDRALLRSMVDAEVGMYLAQGGAARVQERKDEWARASQMRHPVSRFLVRWLSAAFISLGLIVVALLARDSGYTTHEVLVALAIGLPGVLIVWLTFALALLPQRLSEWKRSRQLIASPPDTPLETAMVDVWMIVRSEGRISLQHLRQKIESAASLGAIWPSSLYALLDDLERRAVVSI